MASTARQSKQSRKGMAENAPRRSAWTGAKASPTYSPAAPSARLPNGPPSATAGGFPPLQQQQNGRTERPADKVLQQLTGLTGTTITLSTKTGQRYEAVVGSTNGEGDTTGVTLKDVKELNQPGAPLKDTLFIASTNIDTWSSGPANAKAPNGTNGADTFKTDTDISQKGPTRRERELQAWSDEVSDAMPTITQTMPLTSKHQDEQTFGAGAVGTNAWDQFEVNEKLFGVKAKFDEDVYTTKIDRNAPDYKDREKKAQQIANEILGAASNNPHVAEERVMNFAGEGGANEEDKYGAVVRGAGAYVPPGARKTPSGTQEPTPKAPSPAPAAPPATTAKPELPKVSVNAPDGTSVSPIPQVSASVTSPNVNKAAADPLPAFRNFVTNERDRLMKKKQALMKNEMDKRMAELVKFSQNFKLNKPIPDDLVPILAKDEDKQRQIKEKSNRDAGSSGARAIGPLNTLTSPSGNLGASTSAAHRLNQPSAPGSAKPPAANSSIAKQATIASAKAAAGASKAAATAGKGSDSGNAASGKSRVSMVIQAIPPFKGKRASTTDSSNGPATANSSRTTPPAVNTSAASRLTAPSGPAATPLSPTSANRLNVNASLFRPTTKPFSPTATPSASGPNPSASKLSTDPSPAPQTPNPFFGTRVVKKSPPVHIKDDFNPFKYNKVVDANAVVSTWPYNGKRYISLFPPPPSQPQQQSPHIPPPAPPPQIQPPQPSYEDENAAAAQARGYIYAYPPYGYPGQPMMPGMAPPPPGYMPGPYMQPIPYPHMPPPNAMYPGTPMGQMPPQAYMQGPPPGAYPPPPNGAAPRPSMPPTPIPSHAHPYYHQSPQLQHAVPYPMMMAPPGAQGVPYDPSQPPQVSMGHA